MKYTAIVTGQINGSALRLTGAGELDVLNGTVLGAYDIEDICSGVDSLIFNAVLVTGYPSVCKAGDNAHNPFRSGSYGYVRRIELNDGGLIAYRASCMLAENGSALSSTFELDATLPPVELDSCLPLTEIWAPRPQGGVLGNFSIVWKKRDGSYLTGVAKTEYDPPAASEPLINAQQRRIVLTNERPSPRRLLVHQESELWPL